MFKENSCYFKQYSTEDFISIPPRMPDVYDIIDILVNYEIISIEQINTPIGTSREGQNLTGKKLVLMLRLIKRITYTSNDIFKSVHSFFCYSYHRTYIVVPKNIYGSSSELLINSNLLNVKVLIENINWQYVNDRCIFNGISIFIELNICPTYILSYSEYYNCDNSYLYIDHKDCSNKKLVISFDDIRIDNIKWSLDGKKIAFIGSNSLGSYLFVSHICSNSTFQLTQICNFKEIIDFNWNESSEEILFTASVLNTKDVHLINIYSCECLKLIYSNNKYSAYNAKYSINFEYISYLKADNIYCNLYLKSNNNSNEKQITEYEKILEYDWLSDDVIVYLTYSDYRYSKLKSINLKNKDTCILVEINNRIKVHKLITSPNKRYLAFIAIYRGVENIYIFILEENKVINITNYKKPIKINDFDWSSNSDMIFFSSNEYGCYNLYSVCIFDKEIIKLNISNCENIFVSFRPKILSK